MVINHEDIIHIAFWDVRDHPPCYGALRFVVFTDEHSGHNVARYLFASEIFVWYSQKGEHIAQDCFIPLQLNRQYLSLSLVLFLFPHFTFRESPFSQNNLFGSISCSLTHIFLAFWKHDKAVTSL